MRWMEQMALKLLQHRHTQMGWHIDVKQMTDDLDGWNTTPNAKKTLNLTLPTVILCNYLSMAQIPAAHNTSV